MPETTDIIPPRVAERLDASGWHRFDPAPVARERLVEPVAG